jgi:hypothetical protein
MQDAELVNFWYRALSTAHGVELACSNAESARARLYQVKKTIQDLDLSEISITISPFDPARLWLVKKGKPDETP